MIDKILLRKRAIIESVMDQLKNISQIEHTRHRSPVNAFINIIAGLIAYCYQPKKTFLGHYSYWIAFARRLNIIHVNYFINSLLLLQPMCRQKIFVLKYLYRQPIRHDIAIIHHDRARK